MWKWNNRVCYDDMINNWWFIAMECTTDNIPTGKAQLIPGLGTCLCYRAEFAETLKGPNPKDGDNTSKGWYWLLYIDKKIFWSVQQRLVRHGIPPSYSQTQLCSGGCLCRYFLICPLIEKTLINQKLICATGDQWVLQAQLFHQTLNLGTKDQKSK